MSLKQRYALRPAQKELTHYLTKRRLMGWGLIVWLMREGKTLPVCDWVARHTTGPVLIVCPKQVMPVWRLEFERTGMMMNGIYILPDSKLSFKEKDAKDGQNRLRALRNELGQNWETIIVDEIHRFRYYKKRYRMLKWLSKNAEFLLGLTGTPFDKSLYEMYYPMQWLSRETFWGDGAEITSKDAFHKVYCELTNPGRPHPDWQIKPELYDTVTEQLKLHGSIFRSGKVPVPVHEKVAYPLSKAQRRIIEIVISGTPIGLPERMADVVSEAAKAIRNNKCTQLYSGFFLDDGEVIGRVPTWKWWVLLSKVRRLGARTLIWYRYTEESNLILKFLTTYLPQYVVEKFTTENLDAFKAGQVDILLCHPASAGAGVNISHAQASIFVSHNPKMIDNIQAFFRISQYGDETAKTVYHLVANHRLDKENHKKMLAKENETMRIYNESKTV